MTIQLAQSLVLLAFAAGLGRTPDQPGLDAYAQRIMNDPTQASAVVTEILNSPEGLAWRGLLHAIGDAVRANAKAQAALNTAAAAH